MANWSNNKYYVDVSKYDNIDEILYEFMANTVTNASKSSGEIANSYWGLGMLNVVVPKTEAMIMSQAAELEQLAINDVTAIKFKSKAKKFSQNYNGNVDIETLNEITGGELNKILAFTLNTSIKTKLTTETLKKKIITLLKSSQNYNEEIINKLTKNNLEDIISLFEDFKIYFKEDFIKNKEDRLLMIKSNPEFKKAVVELDSAIKEENENRNKENKLEELDINLNNFNNNYNFDAIIFCGNSIISDEIKSGLPSFMSKYSANWKSLRSEVDVVSTIISNTSIAKDLLFDTNKLAWKASNEYAEAIEELEKNPKISSEERNNLLNQKEMEFVVRSMISTIEFNTFPEIYIHTIINKRDQENGKGDSKDKYLEKYREDFYNRLNSLYKSEDQRAIFENYDSSKLISGFCNIMLHKDTGEYSIQIDEKMAIPFIKNEIKEISYELIKVQLNNIMKKNNISPEKIKIINEKLIENFNEKRLIDKKSIEQSKNDFKSQFQLVMKKAHPELENEKFEQYNKVLSNILNKIDQKYELLMNGVEKIDNKMMLSLHYELKKELKTVFNNENPKLLYSDEVNKVIKNIYEYMNLTNLNIDKDKKMFANIEIILTEQLGKDETKKIIDSDEITTENLRKIHHLLSKDLHSDIIRNLTNVGKSIANFIKGNNFKNICATEDLKSKLLIDKKTKTFFTEQLSRGVYDNKEQHGTVKYQKRAEEIYSKLESTLGIGREYVKLCIEATCKLDKRGIDSFIFLTKFKYSKPEILDNDHKELFNEEYKLKESIIKDMNNGLNKLLVSNVNNEIIEKYISNYEMLMNFKTQILQNKNVEISKIFLKTIEKSIKEIDDSIKKEKDINIDK